MRNLLAASAIVISITGSLFASAIAQPRAPRAEITVAEARAAADAVIARVAEVYVFADKREAIVAKLKESREAGRYDVTSPGALAEALTEDTKDASNDGHMYIFWDPRGYEARKAAAAEQDDKAFFEMLARRTNQGFTDMRILSGNIRYVRWTGAHWNGAVTEQAAADVARFLSGADAVIIDLRDNGGGHSEAVKTFVSYFLPPDGRLLMTFHEGGGGEKKLSYASKKLPAPRLAGKPLYVLTGERSASAAEEFAYHVKQFGLGTLVGQPTAGAANNNALYPVDPGFVLSVSFGYPEHPIGGGNWEGEGVAPDASAPAAKALAAAQKLALENLLASGAPENRPQYEWALAAIEAQLKPVTVAPETLAAYAGQYGDRRVWVENGGLKYQREGRDALDLTPLAPDLFAMSNDERVRIRFRLAGGAVVGFAMLFDDGMSRNVDRS